MITQTKRLLYLCAGWMALVLGVIGIPLPLLPTTPFLLLAAVCFARGSQRWYDWLLQHPQLGPPVIAWQNERAIPRRVKWIGTASLIALLPISYVLAVPWQVLALQSVIVAGVGTFLWTRPEPSGR